jgi:hypothetical protein
VLATQFTLVGDALKQQFKLPSFLCPAVIRELLEKTLDDIKQSRQKPLRTRMMLAFHTIETWSNGCHSIQTFDGTDGLLTELKLTGHDSTLPCAKEAWVHSSQCTHGIQFVTYGVEHCLPPAPRYCFSSLHRPITITQHYANNPVSSVMHKKEHPISDHLHGTAKKTAAAQPRLSLRNGVCQCVLNELINSVCAQ